MRALTVPAGRTPVKRIRVLVVDDSAVVRQVLTQLLNEDKSIEVLGAVSDPLFATEHMKLQWPDVIVLDVEMPRMDGITFLNRIMKERPTPIVICSTLTEKGTQTTLEALAAGAVEIIAKPKIGLKSFLQESGQELIRAVKTAANAQVKGPSAKIASRSSPQPMIATSPSAPTPLQTTERIVAIGTSTGGTQALEAVLTRLGRVSPGIVIVQHMPEKFTAAFASRLDGLCEMEVREAQHGDRVIPGRALIAPGGRHMQMRRSGAQYYVDILDGPPVNRHRPSVDVLFRSVAKAAGANALGIIMTGMGDDGARGLRDMHEHGARTVAQDEASCVVYGMPKEAVKLGAAEQIIPLDQIPDSIALFGRMH
jgi:two-component system, chemotaxis family, protein-glutamate methylesterase/glutaminase